MTFKNWQEMYDLLVSGVDLYNTTEGIYVFSYNDANALCYYFLDREEAEEIAKQAVEVNEYWGAFLGVGGHILDDTEYECYRYSENEEERALYLEPSYDFCKEKFALDGWENTNEIVWDKLTF